MQIDRIKIKRIFFVIAILFITYPAFASDLTKAFKYLNTGDYVNALKYLQEARSDEPDNAAVNFGLAKFYIQRDNKLYQIDSANQYIIRAAKKIPLKPEDKQTKKYLALGVRDFTISALQKEINQSAYTRAQEQNTVEGYQLFIDRFTDKSLQGLAIDMRNQLAYIRAQGSGDAKTLDEYMKKYPDSKQAKEAKELYEKRLYEQTTADNTFQSYKTYIDKYPTGAYIKEAKKQYSDKLLEYYNNRHDLSGYVEFDKLYKDHPAAGSVQDSIYTIATASGTIESFKNFVSQYKNNRNVNTAWQQLYVLYTNDGTEETYRKFRNEFPEYPDKNRVNRDIELSTLDLKPYQRGDKWGYAVQPSKDSIAIIIPFEYEEAFQFKGGFAAVRIKACDPRCTYFYIDKNDHRAIDFDYNYAGDFEKGVAIAGMGNCEEDSCKYGLIDKRGNWVIQPAYDEFNEESEGLYLVSKSEKYGYINKTGEAVITLKYSNALPFSNGIAGVALDSTWFFIDKAGRQLFTDNFNNVSSYKDSLCAVTRDGDNWGYIDMNGAFAIQPVYEDAEDFENGFAVVSKKEKDPKHKGLFYSQRYKIDKTGKVIEKLTAPKDSKKKPTKKKGKR